MAIQFNSNFDETTPFSDVSYPIHLTANNVQTITIPGTDTTQYSALFAISVTSNVYVRLNAVPIVPPANSAALQPYAQRVIDGQKHFVRGGDVLQFITPDAVAYCSVSLMQLPG